MENKISKYFSIALLSIVLFSGCGDVEKIKSVMDKIESMEYKLTRFETIAEKKLNDLENKTKEIEIQFSKVIEQNKKLMEKLEFFKSKYLVTVADKEKAEKQLKKINKAWKDVYDN